MPRGLAVSTDSKEAAEILSLAKTEDEKKQDKISKINEILDKNQGLSIVISQKAKGENFFGSIKQADILDQIEKTISVRPAKLSPNKPIKKISKSEMIAKFDQGEELKFTLDAKAEK